MSMSTSFERIQARAAEAEKKKAEEGQTSEPSPAPPAQQLELPIELLGRGARGVPDSILRSALFSATRPGKRRQLDNEQVPSVRNVDIWQTGPQLQQIDLDVWIELVRLAAEVQSSVISIPVRGLLKRLNRDTGAKSRGRLLSTLERLNASLVKIRYTVKQGVRHYHGTMIFDVARDEKEHLVIQLNPRLAALFDKSSWSALQIEQRHKLKRQPLAQWLHGYLSSHARPFPIKVETLKTLSGSNTKTLFHFRSELRGAIEKVEDVTGWSCQIDSTDKLVVIRDAL